MFPGVGALGEGDCLRGGIRACSCFEMPSRITTLRPSAPLSPQAIIASAMRCYGAMLEVTYQVSEPPEADSWRPLQEGFFAAFSTFCGAALQFSASRQQGGGVEGGLASEPGAKRWDGLSTGKHSDALA